MDPETGVFNCPLGGSYLFVFHIATHDNKKVIIMYQVSSSVLFAFVCSDFTNHYSVLLLYHRRKIISICETYKYVIGRY